MALITGAFTLDLSIDRAFDGPLPRPIGPFCAS
jgi:hypothetical protein